MLYGNENEPTTATHVNINEPHRHNVGTESQTLIIHILSSHLKSSVIALTGVAQWIEHQLANQRVTSSIPSQGMFLGCGPGPQ